jgi:hypothetical protein
MRTFGSTREPRTTPYQIRRKAPAFRHGDTSRPQHVENTEQTMLTGTEPGTVESIFDNSLLPVGRGRPSRKTATMIKVKPGENQARHLDHLPCRDGTQDADKVGRGTPEPAFSQEKANAQGEVLRPDTSGTPRGTVESPVFRRGECQKPSERKATEEAKRLRDALERIVAAHIGNPTPIHYKVKEAIDRGREALMGES